MIDSESVHEWVKLHAPTIQIRDYQIDAWKTIWNARIYEERKRGLVQLATGLGKTSVAAVDVLHYIQEENPDAKILFVAHMNDILSQAKQTMTNILGEHIEQVTFATFQSFNVQIEYQPDYFDYIIWDEAHHLAAETFSIVGDYFKPKFELGLTATPERSDGRDIIEYFGKPIFHKSLSEGISEKWLSAVEYHIVLDQAIKDAISSGFDAKSQKDIQNLFSLKMRNEAISQEVIQRRHNIGLDTAKTILFCQNIQASKEMANLLGGEVYHSELRKEQRSEIFKRFKNGQLQVICTVDMFNEGIDIPDARLIVFLRSTSSKTIFEQQLGRGLRRHPSKDKVTVLDFVANVERIKFVKELGRNVNRQQHGPRSPYASMDNDGLAAPKDQSDQYFDLSSFEFDDETIELLECYNRLSQNKGISNDLVVATYHETRSVALTAKKFDLSTTSVYKHLKRAGVRVDHAKKEITVEMAAEAYYRLGSGSKAGKELGVDSWTIFDRMKRGGYKTIPKGQKYTDEQMISAYKEHESNLRRASRSLGITHQSLGNHLNRLGIDVSKGEKYISRDVLEASYKKHDGDIAAMADELRRLKRGVMISQWTNIYQSLDKHGYIENYDGKVTSARAAAAYYKYRTLAKSARVLGVSGSYISRLIKTAQYIRRSNRK